jgi:hypothetical protein
VKASIYVIAVVKDSAYNIVGNGDDELMMVTMIMIMVTT